MRENTEKLISEISNELRNGLAWEPKHPVVAMYGSARLNENHQAYQLARSLAARLAQEGWTVLTGGGPGIMEAGNRGAFEIKGESVGLNIELPHEQKSNGYQTTELFFNHFTSRKAVFVRSTDVFIAFEGGYGTLDEIFDTVTQIQTGKRSMTTIVLVGKEFWGGLVQWINSTLLTRGVISEGDENLFKLVDTEEEAYQALQEVWKAQGEQPSHYVEHDEM